MSLFAYIKEHLSIIDVISEFVTLKPAGSYWKGSCPFHSEKDASFTISPDKQIFYCFGCHASGDVISFMAKIENMSQTEAAKYLIERYHLSIPKHLCKAYQPERSSEQKDEKERYFLICKSVSNWAHATLLKHKEALSYLSSRNLNEKSITNFNLGYFPSGTTSIKSFMKDMTLHGFLLQDLLKHGILIENRSCFYSPFEERIIFPIKNNLGRHCGFGGRIFTSGDQRPKYYNSKESDGFEKGKLLFGLDMAKKSMQEHGIGFLVEGYMDCIMMVQYGYTNTVATLGTACTHDHLKILSRFVHTLLVLYDGDSAGQKAMLRLTELCWEVNLELKIITLPQGHDPASFLIQGNTLEPLINQASDIITFFINSTGTNFSEKPLAQKMAIAEKITAIVAKLPDRFKQDLLLHHSAHITQLPFASLKQLTLKAAKTNHHSFQPEKKPITPSPQESHILVDKEESILLEEKIFSAILNSLKAQKIIHIPQDMHPFFSTTGQNIIKMLDLFIKQGDNVGHAQALPRFIDLLNQDDRQWIIQASMHYEGQSCHQVIEHLFTRFYKLHWQRIVRKTKEEIVKAKQAQDNQRVQEVLKRFGHLKQEIMQNRGQKL